jgi:hypothetical protein
LPASSDKASPRSQLWLRKSPTTTNTNAKAKIAVMIQNAAQKTVSFETPKLAGAGPPGCWAHNATGLNKTPTRKVNAGLIWIFIGILHHIICAVQEKGDLSGVSI